MNILIIGGTGCLSSAVVAEALKRNIQVTTITRGHERLPPGVESIISDRSNGRKIDAVLRGRRFDAVIDFLCYTENHLEASFVRYSAHTNQYLFISSFAVYNTLTCKHCDEDAPKVLSMWDYSVRKWGCEELLRKLASERKCNYTIIRPGVTYGDTRIPYGITPVYGYHWTLVARVLAGKPLIRWNKGLNRCNMMRVEDFAVGVVGLIGNPKAMNEAFNVCGDETPSFNEVLEAMEAAIDHKINLVDIDKDFYAAEMPERKGELLGGRCIDNLCTNDKLKRAVPSFNPTISLRDGIKRTIEAYRQRNFQKGIDWRFDADTDRIIRKWCRKIGRDPLDMNLGFRDYLGRATRIDQAAYYLTYNEDVIGFGLAKRTLGLLGKIKRRLFK